jgi:hypothetical protein
LLEGGLFTSVPDGVFMSVPCDAGDFEVSVVWPLEVVVSGVELVELPMVPLDEPLTVPLPVCEESTGPTAPVERVVPVESVPVEGAAGRAWSLPVALLLDDEVLLSGLVVLELEEVWSLSLERSRGELESLEVPREGREELRPWALRRLDFAVSPLESLLF